MSNFQAEDSLLSVLMAHNEVYFQVCEIVCADDFGPKARKLYEAIATAVKSGEAADGPTLHDRLGETLGREAMDIACNSYGSVENAKTYAKLVSERGEKRRVRLAGERIQTADSFEEAQGFLAEVRPQQASRVKSVRDGLGEMLEAMQLRASGPYGLSWGVEGLDAVAGLLVPDRLYGIAARAKMGKTTLSLAPKLKAAMAGKRVLDFSLEMSASELVQAALANVGSFSSEMFEREEGVPDEAWAFIHEAAKKINDTPWMIDDAPGLSLEQIESRAIQHHMANPLDLIVVDHVGLIRLPKRKNASRNDELGEVSYGLKNLAKRLHVPIIALLQLNRNLETRTDKRPIMPDLRDSGNLEQDFDCVVSIYRDEVYNEHSADKGHAEIETMFNRHGRGGSVFVSANLDTKTYGPARHPRQCFPLERIAETAEAAASRITAQRERNRREFPILTEIVDMVRARYPEATLVHGVENGREIGCIPADPANWVTIDAVKLGEMANLGDVMNPKRRAPQK